MKSQKQIDREIKAYAKKRKLEMNKRARGYEERLESMPDEFRPEVNNVS